MTDLHHYTLTQLSQMLMQRQTSASELVQHFLQRSQTKGRQKEDGKKKPSSLITP